MAAASASWNGPLAGGLPAHQYPAGVSPQACPNFPNCANPALAANPNAPAPAYNPGAYSPHNQGGYNNGGFGPGFTGAYAPGSAVESGQYTGDGDYRGEGLAESGAYGAHSKSKSPLNLLI